MTTKSQAHVPEMEAQDDISTKEKGGKEIAECVDLPSDHALLQRAQDSLRAQLLEIKQDLLERVREKQRTLHVSEPYLEDLLKHLKRTLDIRMSN